MTAQATWQGVLAGLAVALPLGAISVLLLHEAFAHGLRIAASAAFGVALVDLVYAAAAVVAGAAITKVLAGHERAVRLVGAAVLVVVALRGLRAVLRPGAPAVAATVWHGDRAGPGAAATFARFIGLTLVNPLTAVYFTVLASGLRASSPGAAASFALGVFAGSLAWQLALVSLGSLAGERLPAGVRVGAGVAGYAIVLGYAVRLVMS